MKKGCGKSLCTSENCPICICGKIDSDGKLMLCEKCSKKSRKAKQ